MEQLSGRVAVVTGAASGLGRAMAERFGAAGMSLVLADIDADGLAQTETFFREADVPVLTVPTDVSRYDAVSELADRAYDRFGGVHVLCNNAGVVKRARAWALTMDDWTWVLGVDLWSVIHGIRAFVPRMLAAGEPGHVVNTASMTGLLPMGNLAAYSTAKSAVVGLSESLALDFAAEGVPLAVSVFCPGFVATRITDSARNRPSTLTDTASSTGPRTVAAVASTLTADGAAEHVHDAVVAGHFWILTHAEYRPVIQERAAGIGTSAQPVQPPVW